MLSDAMRSSVKFLGLLALLSFVAIVTGDTQLPCNPGTFGGSTALATSTSAQRTCNRLSQCYGLGNNPATSRVAECTSTAVSASFVTLITHSAALRPPIRSVELSLDEIFFRPDFRVPPLLKSFRSHCSMLM